MKDLKEVYSFLSQIPRMMGMLNMPSEKLETFQEIRQIIREWEEYKDLEAQGKLLKLPCKLGDMTFWISDEDKDGNKIPTVMEDNPIVGIAMQEDGLYILSAGDNEYQKVGTRWAFITREEAETALKNWGKNETD